MTEKSTPLSRAQGCLLGQLAGDALGSQVEFKPMVEIVSLHPGGLQELGPSPVWDTIAGQPTDDSEMALALARVLVKHETFEKGLVKESYVRWIHSNPFDCGITIHNGLHGRINSESQANGALMRISPLGIFGAFKSEEQVARWSMEDALLTHPHPVCVQANILFTLALSYAIRTGADSNATYDFVRKRAEVLQVDESLMRVIRLSETTSPEDYITLQGWVLVAFHNALWQLLHAKSLEAGLVNTVMRGGDTDTNAAIAGALLGAVHGREAIPERWIAVLRNCRPQAGLPGVHHPRQECYWPVDAENLALKLLGVPANA